jgi:hypothetical protein
MYEICLCLWVICFFCYRSDYMDILCACYFDKWVKFLFFDTLLSLQKNTNHSGKWGMMKVKKKNSMVEQDWLTTWKCLQCHCIWIITLSERWVNETSYTICNKLPIRLQHKSNQYLYDLIKTSSIYMINMILHCLVPTTSQQIWGPPWAI